MSASSSLVCWTQKSCGGPWLLCRDSRWFWLVPAIGLEGSVLTGIKYFGFQGWDLFANLLMPSLPSGFCSPSSPALAAAGTTRASSLSSSCKRFVPRPSLLERRSDLVSVAVGSR